jgi:hypothetical protein
VSDSEYSNKLVLRRVVELVRKSAQLLAAHAATLHGRSLRKPFDELHGLLNVCGKGLDGARGMETEVGDDLDVLRLSLGMETSLSGT